MNFYLHKPTFGPTNAQFGPSASNAEFNYPMLGCTRDRDAHERPIRGYVMDHNRVKLGHGQACFERAKNAIRRWEMFDLGWVHIADPAAPIEVGTLAGIVAKSFGFWSFNVCRIVYTLDESATDNEEGMDRFGFGYGTLPTHIERGEERFSIEYHHADQSVWYDILAFSQPNKLIAKVGYPVVRHFQKRFARDSKRVMVQAAQES